MHSIEAFLKELGLEKYLNSFQGMGINYLENIKDLSYDELDKLFTDMGLLKGHLIKCRRRIQELKEAGTFNSVVPAEAPILHEPKSLGGPPSPQPTVEHQYNSSPAQVHYAPPSPQTHYVPPQQVDYAQSPRPNQPAVNSHQQHNVMDLQRSSQIPISGSFLNELENLRIKLSEIEQMKRDLNRVVDSVLTIDVDSYRKILDEISEYQRVLRDIRGRESGDYVMRE